MSRGFQPQKIMAVAVGRSPLWHTSFAAERHKERSHAIRRPVAWVPEKSWAIPRGHHVGQKAQEHKLFQKKREIPRGSGPRGDQSWVHAGTESGVGFRCFRNLKHAYHYGTARAFSRHADVSKFRRNRRLRSQISSKGFKSLNSWNEGPKRGPRPRFTNPTSPSYQCAKPDQFCLGSHSTFLPNGSITRLLTLADHPDSRIRVENVWCEPSPVANNKFSIGGAHII